MKLKCYIAALVVGLSVSAPAALYYADSTPGTIFDNNPIGLMRSTSFSGELTDITAVTLTFTLQNGFGTDLLGYLRLGNQVDSPFYSLDSYLNGLTTIPTSATTYSVNFGAPFIGQNPNNTWTLFFADNSPGGETSFGGWSLDITAVPEPTTWALGIFGGIGGVVGLARWRRKTKAETLKTAME